MLDEDEPTAVTDDDGRYLFPDVAPGVYDVVQLVGPEWNGEFPVRLPDWFYVAATVPSRAQWEDHWIYGQYDAIDIYEFYDDYDEFYAQDVLILGAFSQGEVTDVEIGPGGDLYVGLDTGEDGEILQLTYDGTLLRTIPLPSDPMDVESGVDYTYPDGFDVLPDGRLLVAQPNSRQIVVLETDGSVSATFQLALNRPRDVGILSDGTIVITDADTEDQYLNVRYDDKFWVAGFTTELRDLAGTVYGDVESGWPTFDALETFDGTVWGLDALGMWRGTPLPEGGYEVTEYELYNRPGGGILNRTTFHSLAVANNEVPYGEPVRDFLDGGGGNGAVAHRRRPTWSALDAAAGRWPCPRAHQ